MAIKPKIVTLTNSAAEVLNAIRNNASINYKDYVPYATEDADSVRQIGAIIMDYPALQNEFINALINRIGRVLITSKLYENPWSVFKRGMLEFGETVEEVFVNIAKPFQFDPAVAESEVFKREIPDVRAAFHILNYQKFYKVTISHSQLRQAFLSQDGVIDLATKVTESMYTGMNFDEFLTMKYMIAKNILNGRLHPITIDEPVDEATAKSSITAARAFSSAITFLGTDYNAAGVATYTKRDDQYIIMNAHFDAVLNVNVLAAAFNMSRTEFLGHAILVDSFGALDVPRMNELFGDDPTYEEISQDELDALDAIPFIIVDKNWFMILDNLLEMREQQNGQGLYWNYWLHAWKTFSVSPFANAAVMVPGEPSVTGITVSPSTATVYAGQSLALTVDVTTVNFAPKTVNWASDSDYATVDGAGNVNISSDAPAGTVIEITATSTYDSAVSATATITVS